MSNEPARRSPQPWHDPRDTTLGDACPSCGKHGAWSSLDPSAVYAAPAGHTVHLLGGEFDGIRWDSCPLDTWRPE